MNKQTESAPEPTDIKRTEATDSPCLWGGGGVCAEPGQYCVPWSKAGRHQQLCLKHAMRLQVNQKLGTR